MAVALDLRYKKLACLRRENRETVWTALLNEFMAFYDRKQLAKHERDLEDKYAVEKKEIMPKKQKLTLLLRDSESQSFDDSKFVHGTQTELKRYQEETPIPENEDPLMRWKLNNHRFSVLSDLVQTILCVPATSVPCVRLFSSSGYIVNKMRSCLFPENVNALLCLRDWLK